MAKGTLLASPVIVLVVAVSIQVFSDLKALRSDESYIDFTLRDMDRVLSQNPGTDEISSMRLRLQQLLDDIRRLGLDHQLAAAFFPDELRSTYDLFDEVRQKYERVGPPL